MVISLGERLRQLPGAVLLTGHTGFKGTWLTLMLESLDIPVIGYSLHAEKDSLFERTRRVDFIPEIFADVRDYKTFENFVDKHKPSVILHMAAQPLVLNSYDKPSETFEVNVMGTVNVLDIAFKKDYIKAVVVVTTDKVYRNNDSGCQFVESDALEGKDPYSASKVGSEAAIASWQQIARVYGGPNVVSVRAGNVIGGGDFSPNRLIPDIVRATMEERVVVIRNPSSVRPWQHVLDPLCGYMLAMEKALEDETSKAFNFGPTEYATVEEVVNEARTHKFCSTTMFEYSVRRIDDVRESQILRLDSSLARQELGWKPQFDTRSSVEATLSWWESVANKKLGALRRTELEIEQYFKNYSLK